MTNKKITICRVYDPPAHKEGVWILIDRLWPRGLKKSAISFDLWLKDITPSPELRKWFHQGTENWLEFAHLYIEELHRKPELIESVLKTASEMPVTLFYAAKDPVHNHALVLQATLLSWPKPPDFP